MMSIMKILAFVLLFCFVGVHGSRLIRDECFKQYGVDYDALMERVMTKEEAVEEVTPYRLGCIAMCYLKKKLVDEMPMKKHIIGSLNKGQEKHSKAQMDQFKDTANKCMMEAKEDDCKLLECLGPWDSPIGRLIGIP